MKLEENKCISSFKEVKTLEVNVVKKKKGNKAKMASCSWGQPPDNLDSDESDSESETSEFDFENESDESDSDIELESEGKNF